MTIDRECLEKLLKAEPFRPFEIQMATGRPARVESPYDLEFDDEDRPVVQDTQGTTVINPAYIAWVWVERTK